MSRPDKLDGSREGLLAAQEDTPLRASSEEAYDSSSELGQELDDLDPVGGEKPEYKAHNGQRRRRRLESGASPPSNKTKYPPQSSLFRKIGRWLWPQSTCLIIAVILIGGSLLLIGGGGLWVYKTAPHDGVGQPISQG